MEKLLNGEYAAVHSGYWMSFGIVNSFASVLLLGRGYSNGDIGLIFAAANVVAVFLQPVMADISDRSKKVSLLGVSQISTVILMLFSFGVLVLQKKSFALTLVYIMMFAWLVALQPLLNSLAFRLEESGARVNFGAARSVGSLAYAVLCAWMGTLVEKNGIEILPLTNEILLLFLLLSLVLVGFHFRKMCGQKEEREAEEKEKETRTVRTPGEKRDEENINLLTFIRRNTLFFILTVGVVGVFFANGTLNSFMLQIITPLGGDSEDMGRIFSLLAFLEIPTLFFFNQINKKFSCQTLLKAASLSYVAKITVTWLADSVMTVFLSQLLQLTSFALFLPAMVKFIHQNMSRGEAVKGQALYTAMTTVASILSSLLGGLLLDWRGAQALLLAAVAFTVVGCVIIFLTVDRIEKK